MRLRARGNEEERHEVAELAVLRHLKNKEIEESCLKSAERETRIYRNVSINFFRRNAEHKHVLLRNEMKRKLARSTDDGAPPANMLSRESNMHESRAL